VSALIDRFLRWLWMRRLPVHEEITMRYRAIRGKSVAEFEQEILRSSIRSLRDEEMLSLQAWIWSRRLR
jgi:hypothetical protein